MVLAFPPAIFVVNVLFRYVPIGTFLKPVGLRTLHIDIPEAYPAQSNALRLLTHLTDASPYRAGPRALASVWSPLPRALALEQAQEALAERA